MAYKGAGMIFTLGIQSLSSSKLTQLKDNHLAKNRKSAFLPASQNLLAQMQLIK